MPLDDRKLEVLRAIVEDYVETQEPVGSRALVRAHNLRVSSATVRNDMAVLEEEGYLRQPHTSAGRVPTDKGYRLFVDRLSRIKPLSPAERRAIERFLVGAVDLDDVVHRTVRLLAQLTRQVAMVQYPSLARSRVRHLELVPISTTRSMLVMITDTGRVEQRLVELPGPVGAGRDRAAPADQRTAGRTTAQRYHPWSCRPCTSRCRLELRGPMISLATVLLETLVERTEERIALAGTANLARGGLLDFSGTIRPILEALEEEVILLKLFGQTDQSTDPGPHRRRERDRGPSGHLGRHHRLRAGHHGGRWAWESSDRPGWTTPRISPRSAPWHAMSAKCWRRTDRETTEGIGHTWPGTTTASSGYAGTPPRTRSSAPTGSWPGSTTPT